MKRFPPSFRLLLLGQACSLLGNLTLKFALSMYVLDLTGSAAAFAGLLSAAMLPTILLSPLGGILADRADRRRLMVALDALSGAVALLTLFLPEGLGGVGALLVALSVLGAFESPTAQACVPQLLSGDALIRGNAAVNQLAALCSLLTPFLGSILYAAFGIRPVLCAVAACFFATALFERRLRLPAAPPAPHESALETVRADFSAGLRFLGREKPALLRLLLLCALASLFAAGTVSVGFPFLIRTVLGLSPAHYGAAESAAGVAAILGSLAAGPLSGRLKDGRLHLLFAGAGTSLLLAGAAFLLPAPYVPVTLAFCGLQAACSLFSIFALSLMQARTPPALTGKVMAHVSALSLCAQPAGQILYGALFDAFSPGAGWVLAASGMAVLLIALFSAGFFARLETEG